MDKIANYIGESVCKRRVNLRLRIPRLCVHSILSLHFEHLRSVLLTLQVLPWLTYFWNFCLCWQRSFQMSVKNTAWNTVCLTHSHFDRLKLQAFRLLVDFGGCNAFWYTVLLFRAEVVRSIQSTIDYFFSRRIECFLRGFL